VVIRHSVLFAWADNVSDEQKLRVKEGLAYVSYASQILDLDFGEDLGIGGPRNYGLILLHDHRERVAWDAYNKDPHHHRVGEFIKTLTQPDHAARVDWPCESPPAPKGSIRHMAMYLWKDEVTKEQKEEARNSLAALRTSVQTVRSLEVADDVGWYPPNYHLIVEAVFDDAAGFKAFQDHPDQTAAAALIDSLTQSERTAEGQHLVRSG
jgi:hypothetical protein